MIVEVEVFVRNLSKSTSSTDLEGLFEQAGEVTAIYIVSDRKTGESRGFAFITMSAQSEADKAVSMFNEYALDEHFLSVELVKGREQRGFDRTY